ncbi:urease accessory protein UreD [Nocardioides sp. AN3]
MTTLLPEGTTARRTRLTVEAAAGRPRVRSETSGDPRRPCLRPVIIASGDGYARVCLMPDGALLLAGDAIRLEITLGPDVHLELVEPAGTVAYDMRGGQAAWDVALDVGERSTLVWAGEPFVVAAGAQVSRRTDVRLGVGARLAVRETLVLGRHQERPGLLSQTWAVRDADGVDLLVEEMVLDETAHRPGILGGNRVLGSVVALGFDLPEDVCPQGRLDLERGGTLWRCLAGDAHRGVPNDAWSAVREAC